MNFQNLCIQIIYTINSKIETNFYYETDDV